MVLVAVGAVILAILTPFIGENVNGAIRSIPIMGVSVQAAEPCKLASALLLAYFLARHQKPTGGLTRKGVTIGFLTIALFAGLLLLQGASNAILIVMVGGMLLILAGLPRKILIAGITCAILGIAALGYILISSRHAPQDNANAVTVETVQQESSLEKFMAEKFTRSATWKNRIADWLPDTVPEYEKPTDYGIGGNSQEHHAYMAIAHGRGIGVMPGNSRECSRLQLAFSDYIYAIILEELGLVGGLFVLLCYLGIIIRAGMISRKCKTAYASLLIMGMALVISLQGFYHMCISVGILPVSGQPLPFISKGGTSIFIMSIAMGIMLSVSRYAVERTSTGLKTIDDDSELPQDLRASNPSGIY